MRKTILAAAAALSIAGLGAGAVAAHAQPPPPPGDPGVPAPFGPQHHHPQHHHPDWAGWRHHMRGEHDRFRGPRPGTFALVYPHADRKLTPANVQVIAEAFLLWHGNHSWNVVDVAPQPNGTIGFAYATAAGVPVAHFTMNPHTGRIARVH